MKLEAREYMAFAIVFLFGYVILCDPTNAGYSETLKAAFMLAVGYYLGASKIGSDTASKNADIVGAAAGSSNDPQPVIVANDSSDPVPVEPR